VARAIHDDADGLSAIFVTSVIIFAMFIQVAPLFLTPFLIRVSGSLLGKLAGMAQNQRKGLTGQARNWAQERAKVRAAQAMRRVGEGGGINGRAGTPFQRRAFKRQLDKKYREGEIKGGEEYVDAAWHNDSRNHLQHRSSRSAQDWKAAGEATSNRQYEAYKASDEGRSLQQLSGIKRIEESRVKRYQAEDEQRWAEAESGMLDPVNNPEHRDHRYAPFAETAYDNYKAQRITDSATSRAKAEQSIVYAKQLSSDVNLQKMAGGIDPLGGAKVMSQAKEEVIQAGLKNVDAFKIASDLSPGDVTGLRAAFDEAVAKKDIDAARAYVDMLGESRDAGIAELRKAITENEDKIRGQAGVPEDETFLETFRHFVNSNKRINEGAEDIGVWSRDAWEDPETGKSAWRKLTDITRDAKTWSNMTSANFAGMKANSHRTALTVKDENGNWAISPKIAQDILSSPVARSNIKAEVMPLIEARAEGILDYDANGNVQLETRGPTESSWPPAQRPRPGQGGRGRRQAPPLDDADDADDGTPEGPHENPES
jgi:hypothetical protein